MKEKETYEYINFLIEQTFLNQDLDKEVYYGTIPYSITSTLNKSLDFDFRDDIEYLLFYDDTLDGSGKEGIAIVKKEENYFLILRQYRHNPVIFFLCSRYEMWEINSFFINEYEYTLTIATDLGAKVINSKNGYVQRLDDKEDIKFERKDFYVFRFYNLKFLKLFVELCEQINDKLG